MYGKLDLRNMDCMELMAEYPDNHFDLAIVDPPYGIGIDGQKGDIRKGTQIRKEHKFKKWDSAIPKKEYFTELQRVSKDQIIWGGNYFTEYLRPTKAWIFWYKEQTGLTMSDGELAWTSLKRVTRMYAMHRTHVWQEKPIHPTQKAVRLYKWLLQNYAKSPCKLCRESGYMMGNGGDPELCTDCGGSGTYHAKILDTHLGSGSIAIACYYMGFDLTGSELDEDYYKAMMDRIEKETAQQEFEF